MFYTPFQVSPLSSHQFGPICKRYDSQYHWQDCWLFKLPHCVCVVQKQSWHGKWEVKEAIKHFGDLILDLANATLIASALITWRSKAFLHISGHVLLLLSESIMGL